MASGRTSPFWSLFQQLLEGPLSERLEALGFRRSRVAARYKFRREQVLKVEEVSVHGVSDGDSGSVDVYFGIGFPTLTRLLAAKELKEFFPHRPKGHKTCVGGNLFVIGGRPYDRWFLAPNTIQDQLANEIEVKIKSLGLPFSESVPTLEVLVAKWLHAMASGQPAQYPFNPVDAEIACGLAATESFARALEFVDNRIAELHEIRRVKFNGHPKANAEKIAKLEELRDAFQKLATKQGTHKET